MPYASTSTGQRIFTGRDGLYATAVCGLAARAASDTGLARPADNTATVVGGASGSAASALFKFSNFFEGGGGHALLTGLTLVVAGTEGIAAPAAMSARAYLFNADVAAAALTANADKGTFRMLAALQDRTLGYVDFAAFVGGGAGSDCFVGHGTPVVTPLHLKASDDAADLYAILVATAVFTPVAGAVHTLYASRASL